MSVFRVCKERNYTIMSNRHLQDRRISLKSIGLMSLMLSLPDDWHYTVFGLDKICKDGPDSIKAALRELEAFGYLERRQSRESGKLGKMVYDVYEHPKNEMVPSEAEDVVDEASVPENDDFCDNVAASEALPARKMFKVLPMSDLRMGNDQDRCDDAEIEPSVSEMPPEERPSVGFPLTDEEQQIKTNRLNNNISIPDLPTVSKKESNACAREELDSSGADDTTGSCLNNPDLERLRKSVNDDYERRIRLAREREKCGPYGRESYDQIIDDYFNHDKTKRAFRAFFRTLFAGNDKRYVTNERLKMMLNKLQLVSGHREDVALRVICRSIQKGWKDFYDGDYRSDEDFGDIEELIEPERRKKRLAMREAQSAYEFVNDRPCPFPHKNLFLDSRVG